MSNKKWIERLFYKYKINVVIRTNAAEYEYYIATVSGFVKGRHSGHLRDNVEKWAITHARELIKNQADKTK